MDNHYNCIYMYTNKTNRKRYIGQAKDFNRRHREHCLKCYNKTPIDKAFNKYGEKNFEIKILAENILTQEKLNEYEKFFIKRYNTLCKNNEGYNVAEGGYGNPYIGKTEEELNKIKQKMKDNHADINGSNNPMYGKKHSKESKRKMSEKATGRKCSDETRQIMSKSQKGEKNNFYGKHHSEDTKQKLSEANKGKNSPQSKKIAQYDKQINLIKIYDSIRQAERETGVDHSSISRCCKGKLKSIGGYIWKYAEEVE